ncbi:MAG: hypothetical protein E7161_01165 [Firmicutes bacterium]|nr:hypothetical protein [Bacillota bacterium]
MNRFEVTITKNYIFTLMGESKDNLKKQLVYVQDNISILEMPSINKTTQIKIKRIKNRKR